MAGAGYEVVVVAPKDDFSGSGAAIGPVHVGQSIEFDTLSVPGLEDVPVYGVDGPPALCVLLARIGGFGPPADVVVSGVNPGNNTGRSILHSGTVGAAMTASSFGVSGLAVSIGATEGAPILWDTACAYAVRALDWLVEAPVRTILNLNVPNIAAGDVAGVRLARLAPFGTVRTALVQSGEGRLDVELRATEDVLDPDTDTALVLAGFVAVTPLMGPRAATDEVGGVDVVDRLAGLVDPVQPEDARGA